MLSGGMMWDVYEGDGDECRVGGVMGKMGRGERRSGIGVVVVWCGWGAARGGIVVVMV